MLNVLRDVGHDGEIHEKKFVSKLCALEIVSE
jgi:hypothetical protein